MLMAPTGAGSCFAMGASSSDASEISAIRFVQLVPHLQSILWRPSSPVILISSSTFADALLM